MECKTCSNNDVAKIPYAAYETECARHERQTARLIFVIVLCVVLLVASNAIWLYEWTRYDYEEYTYEQDGRGINIIGDGNEADQYEPEIDNSTENP